MKKSKEFTYQNILKKNSSGFTLIELLIVIAIIGILASVVLSSLNTVRQKARTAQRVSDMRQVEKSLALYFDDHGSYPTAGMSARSECALGDSRAPEDVIPGLVPTYLPAMPHDPSMDAAADRGCYVYISDGDDFSFSITLVSDPGFSYISHPALVDPRRDSGTLDCELDIADESSITAWKVYSSPLSACW